MESSYLKGNMCLIYCLRLESWGVKPCSSHVVLGVHFTREGETFEDLERYRRLVGKLKYLTVTFPDIAHSIDVVSQYMSTIGKLLNRFMLLERSPGTWYFVQ